MWCCRMTSYLTMKAPDGIHDESMLACSESWISDGRDDMNKKVARSDRISCTESLEEQLFTQNLTRFMGLLRKNGLAVGIKESQDAFRIIEAVGIEDRNSLKLALQAILAKSEKEKIIFSSCFDAYFISQEEWEERLKQEHEAEQHHQQQMEAAEQELSFNGQPLKVREELKAVYIQLSEERRKEMQEYLKNFPNPVRNSPVLYTNYISHMVEQQLLKEEGELYENQMVIEENLLYKNIGDFSEEEIPRALQLIQNLTRQLNKKLINRRKKSGKSGTLDFKRTIRLNLQTGGSFRTLAYRRKSKRRKKLLLLCDVSASMLRVSEFALRFIQSMSDSAEGARTFLFSEQLQEVDVFALQDMDSFQDYVKGSLLWCKGTNIGGILQSLLKLQPSVLGSNTIVLIISDAQTVNIPLTEKMVEELKKQSSHIYWFNPISVRRWEESKSIRVLRPYCTMLGCSTLEELALACEKALGGT